jgi:hypothetical protein
LRSSRVTNRSRFRFRAIFALQNSRRVAGMRQCRAHPCQKHPSTNTAIRSFGKTKSGLPNTGLFRLQPVMPCSRKIPIIRSSVPRFPQDRIAAITSLRFFLVKTSGMTGG